MTQRLYPENQLEEDGPCRGWRRLMSYITTTFTLIAHSMDIKL